MLMPWSGLERKHRICFRPRFSLLKQCALKKRLSNPAWNLNDILRFCIINTAFLSTLFWVDPNYVFETTMNLFFQINQCPIFELFRFLMAVFLKFPGSTIRTIYRSQSIFFWRASLSTLYLVMVLVWAGMPFFKYQYLRKFRLRLEQWGVQQMIIFQKNW
jgi:hypothetical protein